MGLASVVAVRVGGNGSAIEVGKIIEVPEDSYLYGLGPIRLKVAVVETERFRSQGRLWLRVYGYRVTNGRQSIEETCIHVAITGTAQ